MFTVKRITALVKKKGLPKEIWISRSMRDGWNWRARKLLKNYGISLIDIAGIQVKVLQDYGYSLGRDRVILSWLDHFRLYRTSSDTTRTIDLHVELIEAPDRFYVLDNKFKDLALKPYLADGGLIYGDGQGQINSLVKGHRSKWKSYRVLYSYAEDCCIKANANKDYVVCDYEGVIQWGWFALGFWTPPLY